MVKNRFSQVLLAVLVLMCVFIGAGFSGKRQDVSQTVVSKLEFDQIEVRDALRELFMNVKVSYSIEPDVHGPVTLSTRNASFDSNLKMILQQVGATYRIESGVYVISHLFGLGFSTGSGIDAVYNQIDVRDALNKMFTGVHVAYLISPNIQGVVRIELKNVTFETALKNILDQIDATYRIKAGVYEIVRRTESFDPPLFTDSQQQAIIASANQASIAIDGKYLYIVKGDTLYKFQKNDLKAVKAQSLRGIALNPSTH